MMDVGGHLIGGHMSGRAGGAGHAPVPPPKPGSYGKGLVAGGAGGKDGVSGDASQSEYETQMETFRLILLNKTKKTTL